LGCSRVDQDGGLGAHYGAILSCVTAKEGLIDHSSWTDTSRCGLVVQLVLGGRRDGQYLTVAVYHLEGADAFTVRANGGFLALSWCICLLVGGSWLAS
jgi:hypothetical protein